MAIIINRTKRAYVFGKVRILPGSNVADIDAKEFPMVSALTEEGSFEISEAPTESDAERAVGLANTQKAVDDIVAASPKKGEKLKKAAEKRKKTLDDFDDEIKAARKKKGDA